MPKHTIYSVRAVPDAIDRLMWEVDVGTDFFGTRHQLAYALFWDGDIVFWRESFPAGNTPGPQTPRRALPARWVNREASARLIVPNERRFAFATELPGDALDRIEHFREGGRLFARVEGRVAVVMADPQNPKMALLDGMLFDLARLMADSSHVNTTSICTEPKELSRDTWCDEILAKLRPEGRHVLEVTVPIGSPAGNESAAALDHQRAAQRSFDEGRYEEVVRQCAFALEQTTALLNRLEARQGKPTPDHVAQQIEATRALCGPTRPPGKGQPEAPRPDRALAHHVLIVTSSLLALTTS